MGCLKSSCRQRFLESELGVVTSRALSCRCAKIGVEWWLANAQGSYDDEHRGALETAEDGGYRFETDFPPAYFGRPPHVHVKVLAPGHGTLTTQIYPEKGAKTVALDLVLLAD